MKAVAAVLMSLALSSCASWQQSINAFEAAGQVSVQAANDNMIHLWKLQGCALPLSAIIRNPDIVPALQSLCHPSTILNDIR